MLDQIGRYEVEGRIGSGGFATVYRVRDAALDSEVAAKVLADNWTDNAEIRDRFIREAKLLRRIDSHRVVTVHDIGELPGGQPYFVMSLANRGTLEDRLMANTAAPAPTDVLNVAQDLAACVRDVHGHDLIHRDIKPSNLLISGGRGPVDPSQPPLLKQAERLLLGDFGLAKDIALQATGLTIAAGTGGYAAPEQMSHGGDPSRATDLYAATAVMYRMLTGTNPPNYDVLNETVPFPDGQWWMAGALGHFFRRGMAFRQDQRHESIDAWLGAFRQAYGGEQTMAAAPHSPAMPTPTSDPVTPPPAQAPDSNPRSAFPSVPAAQPDRDPTSVLPHQQPGYGQQPPSTPATPQPRPQPYGFQSPDQAPVVDPRSVPAVGGQTPQTQAPHSQVAPGTQQGYGAGYGQQPTPHSGYGGAPAHQHYGTYQTPAATRRKRSRWPWLVLLLAVVVAAGGVGGALWFQGRGAPTVSGPDEAQAGELITLRAVADDADTFRWTDFNNDITQGDEFSFRGVVPGTVSVEVQAVAADGSLSPATIKRVAITEATGGPEIEGPNEIGVGDTTLYTFTADGEVTDPIWRVGDSPQATEVIEITGTVAGTVDVTLIVTNEDGQQIGTRKTIEVVGG
ncbi:MAG: protein kinase [Actinomycetota bacterium]